MEMVLSQGIPMKNAISVLLLLTSLSAIAQELDKSARMDNLFASSGVTSWGKRKSRDASIVCKVPKNTNALKCNLRSPGLDLNDDIDREFHGNEAQVVSDLLKEFDQLPYGRRHRQEADINCKNNKNSTEKVCKVIESSSIMGI